MYSTSPIPYLRNFSPGQGVYFCKPNPSVDIEKRGWGRFTFLTLSRRGFFRCERRKSWRSTHTCPRYQAVVAFESAMDRVYAHEHHCSCSTTCSSAKTKHTSNENAPFVAACGAPQLRGWVPFGLALDQLHTTSDEHDTYLRQGVFCSVCNRKSAILSEHSNHDIVVLLWTPGCHKITIILIRLSYPAQAAASREGIDTVRKPGDRSISSPVSCGYNR